LKSGVASIILTRRLWLLSVVIVVGWNPGMFPQRISNHPHQRSFGVMARNLRLGLDNSSLLLGHFALLAIHSP
jgi:hypothetical protein